MKYNTNKEVVKLQGGILKGQMGVTFHIKGDKNNRSKEKQKMLSDNIIKIESDATPFLIGPVPPKEQFNKWWLSNRRDKLTLTSPIDWKQTDLYPMAKEALDALKYKYEPWEQVQSISTNRLSNIGGYYDHSTHTVHLPYTIKHKNENGNILKEIDVSNIPSIYVHETAHGAFIEPEQSIQINRLLDPKYNDSYLDSPTEINSRLMQLRFQNGFNPNHIFTKEEVENLKQNPNVIDYDILNRYDSETIVNLLNEVASNKITSNPNLAKHGGIMKSQNNLPSFEDWYKTVPKDYNDTTRYNLRRAYELVPFKKLERWRKNPEKNHLNSVYKNENGDYEFLKLPGHSTLNLELDWYNKADKFKKKYQLDTTSIPWKYVRK